MNRLRSINLFILLPCWQFCFAYYVLEISISVIHYTMPTKYCKWGTCKSYSKKDKTIKFFPFPKPCKDFRMLMADPTLIAIQHDADTCVQCSKCTAWIRACSTTKFSSLEQINRNSYVCYKHFPDGTPTEDQPIPICARSFSQVSNYYIQYIYRYIMNNIRVYSVLYILYYVQCVYL